MNGKAEYKCERGMDEYKSGGIGDYILYLCERGRLNEVVENKCEMVMDED